MSFQPADLTWKSEYLPTKTATDYNPGSLLYNDATDNVPSVAGTTRIIGIIDEDKPASDTSTDKIKVLIPTSEDSQMYGDVGTGTLTVAMIGREVDLKDEDEVDVTASATDSLIVSGYISGTRGLFKINKAV